MRNSNVEKKYKYKYWLLIFSRNVKYIGILSAIAALVFDSLVFSLLALLTLFAVVEVLLDYSVFKAMIRQYLGALMVTIKYGFKKPSIDNYENETPYDLPFKGEWAVINGSYLKEHSHSWGIPTQRYAYDFVKVDEAGRTHAGDATDVEQYHCYDEEIIAPADGKVVEVYNEAEDSLIFGPGKFLSRSPRIGGNYVVIQHTPNEYSTLAHLKKDSIQISPGDPVTRGQTIATCGNTGNSTEPHLHFQLQNHPSFFNSLGLPIKFENAGLYRHAKSEHFDPRPSIPKAEIPEGYITRGYIVYNNPR